MSGRHREGPPEDCQSCRKLFAVLTAHHQAQPDTRITVAELGSRIGMSRQSAHDHVAHLVRHRRLKADRRTPVPGATVRKGDEAVQTDDSEAWAVNQLTPDRACALLLPALALEADRRWAGQTTTAQLAARADMPVRTVERHRPHLGPRKARDAVGAVRAGLVEFTPDTVLSSNGRHRVRRGDRFRFLAGRGMQALTWKPGESLADPREFEGTARALVDAVRWYTGPPAEFEQAYRRVSLLLARGHRPEDLLRALTSRTPDSGRTPFRLLSAWLPALGDDPAPSALTAVRGAVYPLCADCGAKVRPGPGVALCKGCRADRARYQLPVPVARLHGVDQRVPA